MASAAQKVQEAVQKGQATQVAKANTASPNKKPIRTIPADVQKLETKSAKIRELHARNWTTGDIARAMGILYQHARNVINQPLKRKAD